MRSRLSLLVCLLLCAQACMAQSRPADPPAEADDAPRSAFGRVMGIMIESLRQEAMREPGSSGAGTPQEIEVGAAFRLQPETRIEPAAIEPVTSDPPCDVQPCEHVPVPNLRIASQK